MAWIWAEFKVQLVLVAVFVIGALSLLLWAAGEREGLRRRLAERAAEHCSPAAIEGVERLLDNGNGSWAVFVQADGQPQGTLVKRLIYAGEGTEVLYKKDAPADGPMRVTMRHDGDRCGGTLRVEFHIHDAREIGGGEWRVWQKTGDRKGVVVPVE